MLDAVVKALGQMFSPPFRRVLLKSVGLAIAFLGVPSASFVRPGVGWVVGGVSEGSS